MRKAPTKAVDTSWHYHLQYHNLILGDAGYQSMTFEARGIYFHYKQIAEQNWDEGYIKIGNLTRVTLDQLVDDVAGKLSGHKQPRRHARQLVQACITAGLFVLRARQAICIANAADERVSRNPESRRKSEWRQRQREDQSTPPPAPADSAAPALSPEPGPAPATGAPPPPPCASTPIRPDPEPRPDSDPPTSTGQKRDMSRTCPDRVEVEVGVEERDKNLSTSTSTAQGGGGGGSRPDVPRPLTVLPGRESHGHGTDVDIYALDVVDAAVLVTGDRDPRSRGYWTKILGRRCPDHRIITEDLFRSALAEFLQAKRDRHPPALSKPGAYLNGCLLDKITALQRSTAGGAN